MAFLVGNEIGNHPIPLAARLIRRSVLPVLHLVQLVIKLQLLGQSLQQVDGVAIVTIVTTMGKKQKQPA